MSTAEGATDKPKVADEAAMSNEARVASPELSDDQLEKCIGGLGDILRQRPDFLL